MSNTTIYEALLQMRKRMRKKISWFLYGHIIRKSRRQSALSALPVSLLVASEKRCLEFRARRA